MTDMKKYCTSLSSGITRLEKSVNQEGFVLDIISSTGIEDIGANDTKYHNNALEGVYFAIDVRIVIPKAATSQPS